ncbi:unnamed protein product [Clonostachys rhizophaga]|uniref:Xylanolytic transcriptional activator regulatory domain-containing protein n=1 Tax=Clonostachys rhizophaga TaxID=160324 RepID=A0A9N9VV22_9HYPO|nr:unnamed protein product [Clonostachys rhizophaga]
MQRSHRRSTKVCASLVRSLEARVAELEGQVLNFQAGTQNTPYLMASKVAQATISFGLPSSNSYLHSKISSALVFRPSCPPLALVRDRGSDSVHVPHSSTEQDGSSSHPKKSNLISLKSIPSSAISRMIRNYADMHLPQYPCITEAMLQEIVKRTGMDELGDTSSLLLNGIPADSGIGHFEYFVLFIALAISAMTLTWKAEDQARAASESFFNSALKHLQVLEEQSEIKSLQISLLLAHYAHMCPERVDNWTCISDAVRIVLNLGLHRECTENIDIEHRRLRAELFWVTYGMERSLCTNLRLPLSFPEEAITTKRELFVEEGFNSLFTNEDLLRKSASSHICLYRALETEVHRVLHLEDNLLESSGMSIEAWIIDINTRLGTWYEAAQVYTQYGMLEFKHVQYHHLRARIHRPTPRLMNRTNEDREQVLQAAIVLIDDYHGQESRRRLFYPWHGVHILFEVVVIALEACWTLYNCHAIHPLAEELLKSRIPQCLQMLRNIGERWNEATACARRLQPLLDKITTWYYPGGDEIADKTSISEEIRNLLLSDGSLTWNQRVASDIQLPVEAFLFDDVELDNFQFLEWAPEWDILPTDFELA